MKRLALLACLMFGGALSAQEAPHLIRVDSLDHSHERAGYPLEISRFAQPNVNPKHRGGWFGGGSFFSFGRSRGVQEGTWGSDYTGLRGTHPLRIFNNWTNGHELNGGSYINEGPVVPDVFARKPKTPETASPGGDH